MPWIKYVKKERFEEILKIYDRDDFKKLKKCYWFKSRYWKLKNSLILKLHLIEFYFCKFIPTNESIFAWFLR